ncbi:MAG: CRISPR-associated endonuclease Cas6 [Petrotogales bacterium]
MKKELEYAHLRIKTDRKVEENGEKLRGFFANKFDEDSIVHHHTDGNKLVYSYPKVQYSIVEGEPIVTGLQEGKEAVVKMLDCCDELKLGGNEYKIENWSLDVGSSQFGLTREQHYYSFVTPWLALNSENYEKYKKMDDWEDRKKLLNSILTGNILSAAQGFNIVVENEIYVHTHLYQDFVEFKGMKFKGFTGKFKANFELPELIGLGKGVSRGFGKIIKRKKGKN